MPRLTLTFDNGPTPGITEQVLDVLEIHGIKTTFFCVGSDLLLPQRRELAQRAHAEGHWHGNHTLTHSIQFGMSDDPRLPEREIGQSQEILGDLAHPEKFFRPWGDGKISQNILSAEAIRYLTAGGYTLALWTAVPRDWEDPNGWVDRAMRQIRDQDWALMVVHDQDTGAMAHLDEFFERLAAAEIEVVQELPPHATPIRNGQVLTDLTHLYRADDAGAPQFQIGQSKTTGSDKS